MANNRGEQVDIFLRHLEKYDFASARTMCTTDAGLWQNDGKGELALSERLDQFESFVTSVKSMRYEVTRRFQDSDEVLQQQVLHLEMNDGTSSEGPAAVYFRFTGDRISRIEEFLYDLPKDSR